MESWFVKVQRRDFLGEGRAKDTMVWLDKCRFELQKFAVEVFTHEGYDQPGKEPKNFGNSDYKGIG